MQAIRDKDAGKYEAPSDDTKEKLQYWLKGIADPATTPDDRLLFIRSFGIMGYPWRLDQLITLLREPEFELKNEIVLALEQIAGEPLGADPAVWEEWYPKHRVDSSPSGVAG